MLTKEECKETLRKLHIYSTLHADWQTIIKTDYYIDFLYQLIEEHFELLEKYKALQDENGRLNFNNIANNINDMNYKLWLENPPLTIEEIKTIKVGTWLWDSQSKRFKRFNVIDPECIDVCKSYFENRFYRKQVTE